MRLRDWMVIQQKDGYGELVFEYDVPDKWAYEQEEQVQKSREWTLTGICCEVREEDTGRQVLCETDCRKKASGTYSVALREIPAGGLYSIFVELLFLDADGAEMKQWDFPAARHVGVGDVYLIAGQSNAAGWGRGTLLDGAEIGVSMLRTDGNWDLAAHPMSGAGHSPFLAFAKIMHRRLGYPIGLIPRAVGGVPADCWVPGGELMERLKEEAAREELKVKAVLWYQGCSDVRMPEPYCGKFESFVREIRETFADPALPVFTFQLNRLQSDAEAEADDEGYSRIREIQRQIPKKIPGVFVLPTIDSSMSDAIHNGRAGNLMLGNGWRWRCWIPSITG